MSIALLNYTGKQLIPAYDEKDAIPVSVNFVPNLSIAQGQIVASLTGAAANDVQTLKVDATSGTFTLSMVGVDGNSYTTAALAFNISTASLATALAALAESAGFHGATATVTGGVGSSGGGNPYVITWGGTAASYPMPLMTPTASVAGGGAVGTNVHTTSGQSAGWFTAYNGAKIANPGTAPTVADGTGAGTLVAAQSYAVGYTFTNALGGETLQSPITNYAVGTGKSGIAVTPHETVFPAGATGVNFYINGILAAQATVLTATTILTYASTLQGGHAPNTNTASVATDGSQIPLGIAPANFKTDALGRVIFGNVPIFAPGLSQYDLAVPVYVHGFFFTQDLVNLDANAAGIVGRLVAGTISQGVIHIN